MTIVERPQIEEAWQRAGGRCECTRAHHKHAGGRCGLRVEWINRGRHGEGAWEAQRLADSLDVQILCWDCHAKQI